MSEANKAVVRRLFEDVFNKRILAAADELLAGDIVRRQPLLREEIKGRQAYKQFVTANHIAYADFHITACDLIAEGDSVVSRWTVHGTHMGELSLSGIHYARTGREVTLTGIDVFRVEDGKITEDLCWFDALDFLRQLGLVTDPETLEANKALVRRLFDEVVSQGNLATVDEIVTNDYIYHLPHFAEIRRPEGLKQHIIEIRAVFPDLRAGIEDLSAEGDTVIVRTRITGTHSGEWAGTAPTGKVIAWSGTFTYGITGEKIAETWADWDALGFFQQLGAVPPLGQARAAAAVAGVRTHLNGPEA